MRIRDPHSGCYEELHRLEYNIVQALHPRRKSSSSIYKVNYVQYTKQQMITARNAGPLLRDFVAVSDELRSLCEMRNS